MGKYAKRPDGRYCTRTWDGTYKADGTKRHITLYARSVRELDRKARELAQRVADGNIIKHDDFTFLTYSAKWFFEAKSGVAKTTKEMYAVIIESYFTEAENVHLEDFRYIHAKRILDKATGKANLQNKIIMTIKQVLRAAVRDRKYPQAELDILIQCFPKIKIHPKEKRILTPGEKSAVLRAELPPKEKTFLLLIYGCGLRREEALALTPFDFDFKAGTVRINKAMALLNDGTTDIKPPKSVNGTRTVPVPQSIRRHVEDYVKTCTGGLFPGVNKTKYRTIWSHIKAEIEHLADDSPGDLTAHIFRHNYCTELCYQIPTISIKNVARLLGDTEAMVMKVYSHIDLDREPTGAVISAVF